MAFNSWDKLAKSQHDYPKPKFALAVVDKALKKQPNNPYLLTWKSDLALQLAFNQTANIVATMAAVHQQKITDTRLLEYMYNTTVEALRRSEKNGITTASTGVATLSCWQSTAKSMQRKNDRMALWDTLFAAAMREDCWEDARFAIVNYNKEGGASDKKHSHYSLILATQLAAEQKFARNGPQDRMAQLQSDLAMKLLKQSFEAPPEDALAMKTIRDLRFMASIFGRQKRSKELEDVWLEPPRHIQSIVDRHRPDILMLMIKLMRDNNELELLEEQCLAAIEETIGNISLVGSHQSNFWELCAWRWDLWDALLHAVSARPTQVARQIISNQLRLCFGSGLKTKDRPLQLTYMKLRQFAGELTIDDCRDYYQHHYTSASCFNDMKPFMNFLNSQQGHEMLLLEGTSSLCQSPPSDSQITIVNFLKFQYQITMSGNVDMRESTGELFVRAALAQLEKYPQDQDLVSISIYAFLNIHHRLICKKTHYRPFEAKVNSRVLLQATMLARHLVEKDKDKHMRTFALLAARLHLNLGLGTVAFRLYRHTKCKEMLLDTLSPYMLSRISQTHPFDSKGYGGFSADDELAKVVGTIDRMERKTDDYLFTDLGSFLWDQATDTLELKRKLNSSLTKHLCLAERRRIARFKGESVETLPKPKYKAYRNVSDNVDRAVFPDFEQPGSFGRVSRLVMPNIVPTMDWLFTIHLQQELAMRLLHGEEGLEAFDCIHEYARTVGFDENRAERTAVEQRLETMWSNIHDIASEIHYPGDKEAAWGFKFDPTSLPQVLLMLEGISKTFGLLRMPSDTTLAPEDEITMFHENMLMSCYGHLEVVRAIYQLANQLVDKVIKKKGKPHPLIKCVPPGWEKSLIEEVNICYNAIRDVAFTYMDLIKSKGLAAIKAQVRWGFTGQHLRAVLSDDDVDYYAREYVESALEAWSGVLKVKLK